VLFAKYSGTEVKMDGKKLLIMRERRPVCDRASLILEVIDNGCKTTRFSEEARRKLRNGMNVVANASVRRSGQGRNVAVDRKFGSPTVTHDGVSVAKEIELERCVREHGRSASQRSRHKDQ